MNESYQKAWFVALALYPPVAINGKNYYRTGQENAIIHPVLSTTTQANAVLVRGVRKSPVGGKKVDGGVDLGKFACKNKEHVTMSAQILQANLPS